MVSWRYWDTRAWCILVILWLSASKCSSHLSNEDLRELLSKEQYIFKEIRHYQEKRADELERLKSKVENLEREHQEASEDLEAFFGNPLNAYRIIKRLIYDWNSIHAFITNANTTRDFTDKWLSDMEQMELPGESDLHDAIGRLINANDAIDGAGAGNIYGPHMKWDECYEVGVHLFDTENFFEALTWFELALQKLRDDDMEYSDDFQADLVEYIAFSQYLLGDVPGAYSMLKRLDDSPLASANIEEVKTYMLLNANSFGFARISKHGGPHIMGV